MTGVNAPYCAAVVLASALMSAALADPTGQRTIDVSKSTVKFSVQHVFVGRVSGTVPIVRGQVILRANSPVPVSASGILDAAHIDTGDRDQTSAIRGPDFF